MTDSLTTSSISCVTEADWRFLLPAGPVEHLILLGGPPSAGDTLVDLGIATRISRSTTGADPADLVVLLADATESIEAVAPLLRPGGAMYWEVDRRRRGQWTHTPRRAIRRLQRCDLTPAAAYWVKPGFDNRQMYLPLGAVGPFRWYLDTLYRSHTPVRRLLDVVLRTLSLHRRGLDTFAPCFAITAMRGGSRSIGLLEEARRQGVPIRQDAVPVLLGQGSLQWNRTVLAVFHPEAPSPATIIKVPRMAAFNDAIEWEHNTLRQLDSRLERPLRDSIPTSRLFRWNGLAIAAETCVPGAAVSSRAGPTASESLEDLRLTVAWLTAFHRETTIERVPAQEWLAERLFGTLCAEYADVFGLSAAEAEFFRLMRRQLGALGPARLPIVWQHADFCPPNVYLDGRTVFVIDWETARHGPALADLLVFITYWAAMVNGHVSDAACLAHFERLLFGSPTPLSAAVRGEIAGYMRELDLAPSLFPFLSLYTFVERALARPRRMPHIARAHAATRAENVEVGYVALFARHVERLMERELLRAA